MGRKELWDPDQLHDAVDFVHGLIALHPARIVAVAEEGLTEDTIALAHGFDHIPRDLAAGLRQGLALGTKDVVEVPAEIVGGGGKGALHLHDVKVDALGVIGDGVAVGEDVVVGRLPALHDAVFTAGVRALRDLIGVGLVPHAALEVVDRVGLEARLVETRWVTVEIELVEVAHQRETHFRVLVDAFAEKDIALWAPAGIGLLQLLLGLALREERCDLGRERHREEDSSSTKGLNLVSTRRKYMVVRVRLPEIRDAGRC
jgi:hypothetical protein